MHKTIIVPGLSDTSIILPLLTHHWKRRGIMPIIHLAPWRDKESFQRKLERLLNKIDALTQAGNTVSLVGLSAGGSLVMHAYLNRREKISSVVNIAGRLRAGRVAPSLFFASFGFPAFRQSVTEFEKLEDSLSHIDKQKIMTVRGFMDGVVPGATIGIEHAYNIKISAIKHPFIIGAALTLYSKRIIDFIIGNSM